MNPVARLQGRSVVVTRPRHQAGDLVRLLEGEGARVLPFPAIRIVPPSDPAPLRREAERARSYDWIVLTSANAVRAFGHALREVGEDPSRLRGPLFCAIGPGTAAALEELGIAPDLVPDRFVAEGILDALDGRGPLEGNRILLPRAAEARDVLPRGLRERGAAVMVVEAYRTVPALDAAGELRGLLDRGSVDLLTFTASSTVKAFHGAMGADVGRARVAVIGPVTARTAGEVGLPVHAVARQYTIRGLVEACVEALPAGGADR